MATLQEVNDRLAKVDIKGKAYVSVNQRLLGFWELYPDGAITTEMLADTGERCCFKATAWNGEKIIATGHAFEDRKSFINKTSYVENCETSAVGRALGMLGIGATDSIASADEVASAINHQEEGKTVVSPTEDERVMAIATARLTEACGLYAGRHGMDVAKVKAGVAKRPDYKQTADFYNAVAEELEEA